MSLQAMSVFELTVEQGRVAFLPNLPQIKANLTRQEIRSFRSWSVFELTVEQGSGPLPSEPSANGLTRWIGQVTILQIVQSSNCNRPTANRPVGSGYTRKLHHLEDAALTRCPHSKIQYARWAGLRILHGEQHYTGASLR